MTDKETLLRYRIKQAEETLADAEAMRKGALSTRSIVNRAYYAMFYALLGLFLETNVTLKTSKHSGIISMFDQVFILIGLNFLHIRFRIGYQQESYRGD
jgi:uncharacterized protein (UPF0332 family)